MILLTVHVTDARGKLHMIGATAITNDGTATDEARGNYSVNVARRSTCRSLPNALKALFKERIMRSGRVENFPRHSYNVWRLVIRALKSAFPEEA